MDLRIAAALPTVLPSAYALIHEVGRLRSGESVLVHGAAGGVGTVAGQLARAAGAGAVYGVVSSAAKAEYALKYGYDEVFTNDSFPDEVRRATGGRGVDLVLDPMGGDTLRRSLDALAVFGRLVSSGNASGAAAWHVGQTELYPQSRTVAGFSILGLAKSAPRVTALDRRARLPHRHRRHRDASHHRGVPALGGGRGAPTDGRTHVDRQVASPRG